MSDPSPPTVVIVDDHELFRAGVKAEIAARVAVLGEAGSVADAITLIRQRQPDVVLLDVHVPDGGGLEIIRTIGAELPGVRFLALSVSDAPEDVIDLIRAGARGYVTKTITAAELVAAIERVAGGEVVLSPTLAGFVLDAFAGRERGSSAGREVEGLTRREVEVLELIARGYLYKEIAHRLGISAKTVESHVSSVLRKLNLSNRHQLARWAAQRRIGE
ncbi:response regulator transcription factor [Conexibacter sp. S30A1]|uniref:response regulator n=1 Tax=Conexibacter sp. S30A1 TaxID=2937800 RepID=UPI00200C76CF|nr:response regulator transcription factor [Conexibacter sp. S30A1]